MSTALMSPMPYETGLARPELRRRPQFTQLCCRVRAGQRHQGSGTHTQQPGGQRLSDDSPTRIVPKPLGATYTLLEAGEEPADLSPTPLTGLHGGPGFHPDQG